MSVSESYTTIAKKVRSEIRERGSRFIGTAIPVESREQAMEELETIRKEFWDATHNCYAYRLAPDGNDYRFSDDGEPSGSAGKPLLFVLQQQELMNVLVVVTRYFGGTKLGVGGLVRAYSESAVDVLKQAEITIYHPTESLRVYTTYDDIRAIRQLVERYAVSFEEEFGDVVYYNLLIRSDRVAEFDTELTAVSQGRAGTVKLDTKQA